MVQELSSSPDTTSLFCTNNDRSIGFVFYRFFTASLILGGLLILIVKYTKKRDQTPIKERSALLSIFQMVGFWTLLLIQFINEILLLLLDQSYWSQYNREQGGGSEARDWRSMLKSLYISVRVMTYLIFLVR